MNLASNLPEDSHHNDTVHNISVHCVHVQWRHTFICAIDTGCMVAHCQDCALDGFSS